MARAVAISDPREVDDPGYLQGLRATISAAVSYALVTIEAGADAAPPIPGDLLGQARHAARCGVNLDTVLRRYIAGYQLFGDLLVGAAEPGIPHYGQEMKAILSELGSGFDRLVEAVSAEHASALMPRSPSYEERRLELVSRLLGGETTDAADLGYELDQSHLALVASGRRWPERLRALARDLDRLLLMVRPAGGGVWAWLGGRRPLDPEAIVKALQDGDPGEPIAIGEPATGLSGWSLTHQQARAALTVAHRKDTGLARYRDVALLAAALRDELLCRSLESIYLRPLAGDCGDGKDLRRTVGAFLATGRNASSTAARLGIHRHTVQKRIRFAEERIGHPLDGRVMQLYLALQLNEFAEVRQFGDH